VMKQQRRDCKRIFLFRYLTLLFKLTGNSDIRLLLHINNVMQKVRSPIFLLLHKS
jgi:hypothetical protein